MLEAANNNNEHERIAQLESLLAERTAEVEAHARRIRLLEEALRVLQADKYGASREKLAVSPGQRSLFNEAEATIELTEVAGVEPALTVTPLRQTHTSQAKAGPKALAAHLPRVEIRHELPAIERICACGNALQEIAVESSEQLDYVPAKIQVIRHVRPKYACAGCHIGESSWNCLQRGEAYAMTSEHRNCRARGQRSRRCYKLERAPRSTADETLTTALLPDPIMRRQATA